VLDIDLKPRGIDAVALKLLSRQSDRMSKVRRALYLQVGSAIAMALLLSIASRFFPIADWLSQAQLKIMHLGAWSAICYPLLYACCNVLLLPGGLLSIGGGFFFGLWWGFLIVFVGNITGAAIAFFISRGLGRGWLRQKLRHNPTFDALEPAVEREGWKIILLSQLHPLFPTSLLNYLYGLTAVRFRTCILWIAIGQVPGLFLYAYIGTLGQLGLNLVRGQSHPRIIEYIIWGGGLIFSIVVLILLGRISLRLLQEAEMTERVLEGRDIRETKGNHSRHEVWAVK
jgi:uncharacterized membrane protein YdjX (TVP38/TMEM64 family)